MAWDNGKFCGYEIVSGDKPIDQLSIAINKISLDYIDRFGRKPSTAEILYVFKIVILSNGPELLSDPGMIDDVIIKLNVGKGSA
ncbi:MAG: hypothetical protein P8179_19775 [Candidatus Thiodiazotropha sp.]|jgi:hypothetical protein